MKQLVALVRTQWQRWHERSVNRRIFAASLVVGGCTLLVNLALFARELVVAQRFGTGDALDAFLIAYLVPSFAISVVAGTFGSAFLPTYIQVLEHEGRAAAEQLFAQIFTLCLTILFVLTSLLALLSKPIFAVLATGFHAEKLALTRTLFLVLLPALLCSGVAKIAGALLNAHEAFALAALAPLCTPALAMGALFVWGEAYGIFALGAGTLAGFACEAALIWNAARRHGARLRWRWDTRSAAVRRITAQYVPVAASAVLMTGTGVIDQAMAAMLAPGSVAALGYGNKVVAFVLGLASVSLGTAIFPHFARMVARADWLGLRHTFRTYARLLLGVIVPLTAVCYFFSEPMVRLIFERGAFSAADTELVGRVQAFYFLQMPFHLLGILGVRILSAMARNQRLLRVTAINLVVNVLANYVFMHYLGVAGIALSTSLVYLVSMSLILWTLQRELKSLE